MSSNFAISSVAAVGSRGSTLCASCSSAMRLALSASLGLHGSSKHRLDNASPSQRLNLHHNAKWTGVQLKPKKKGLNWCVLQL